MYAVVEIAGKQLLVEPGQEFYTEKLAYEPGQEVVFDKVLLLSQSDKIEVGTPVVKKAEVVATVLGSEKGEKITILKKKRRKGYTRKQGYRALHSRIVIKEIKKN